MQLLTGEYGRMQSSPLPEATTDASWGKLRGVRLAEHMIFAHDLDPKLDDGKMPTQALAVPRNSAVIVPDSADLPVMRDFQYGFTLSSGNETDTDIGFNHAVYAFSSPTAATAATKQFSDLMLRPTEYSHYRLAAVPGMPTGAVVIHDEERGTHTVVAFTAVGARMIYTWAQSPDRSWAERIVKDAYEKQKALLDEAGPESQDRDPDPDHLITGTVADPDGQTAPLHGAVYSQRAAALFYSDQAAAYEALKKAGIEQFAWNDTQAYKAGSHEQAEGWLDFLEKDTKGQTGRSAASPQDLSTARCVTVDQGAGCFIAVGPYVGEAYGEDLTTAQEKISAQYTFLTKLDQ
ncbi:hypothetical protein GCM10023197_15220 [Gordonia humi]